MTTLSPGTCTNQDSSDCECWAPSPTPAHTGARTTRGMETIPAAHVAQFGRVVDDLIHGDGHEIQELQFDDRPCSDQCRAHARPRNRRLGNGCVNHALASEFFP